MGPASKIPGVEDTSPVMVLVRPTRHIQGGFQPGYVYSVDLRDPKVKKRLASGAFVLQVEHDAEVEQEVPDAADAAPVPAWETDVPDPAEA